MRQILHPSYETLRLNLPMQLKEELFNEILAEVLGFGVLQPLLDDPTISEVMVNGRNSVYIERNGKLEKTGITFDSDAEIVQLIEKIIFPLGSRIDIDSPTVDARLPDGSRVNATIPPVTIDGPTITIRKFKKGKLTVEQLIEYGSLTPMMAEFIRACVIARLNIVISGGTGSGKTTPANVLSSYIPGRERIITIEDAAELQLQQRHVVRLESRPPNVEGKGQVPIRQLVINALRMRPDRIVVGEVRGGEALDMLQAMNTGHDGSLTTAHSNSPRDTLARVETMVLMAGMDMPIKVIREQIAPPLTWSSSVAFERRLVRSPPSPKSPVWRATRSDRDFRFEQTGIDPDGKVIGQPADGSARSSPRGWKRPFGAGSVRRQPGLDVQRTAPPLSCAHWFDHSAVRSAEGE